MGNATAANEEKVILAAQVEQKSAELTSLEVIVEEHRATAQHHLHIAEEHRASLQGKHEDHVRAVTTLASVEATLEAVTSEKDAVVSKYEALAEKERSLTSAFQRTASEVEE